MHDLLRAWLFRKDPEDAHDTALSMAAWASDHPIVLRMLGRGVPDEEELRREVWGLEFPNPCGLAAGFDKDGVAVPAMAALGFGFVEVGTVTPEPQQGNPRPRMFRHPDRRALVNRLGFPNVGVEQVAANLADVDVDVPVGINVGMNRDTPLDAAHEDHAACLERLWEMGDYFVVNVSSPNTPGLRDLEQADRFEATLRPVLDARDDLGDKPLLAKFSPDLDADALAAVGRAAEEVGVDGLVATNTSSDASILKGAEEGGISGAPLAGKARTSLQVLADAVDLPLMACGGILDGKEAAGRLDRGAALFQFYTALVYRGPEAPARILRELLVAQGA